MKINATEFEKLLWASYGKCYTVQLNSCSLLKQLILAFHKTYLVYFHLSLLQRSIT